jgi:hypothetical protein
LAGPGKHVEVDETLIGGKSQARDFGSRLYKKTMVMGMVERGGKMRAGPVPDDRIDTLEPLAVAHVHKGTIVSTDGLPSYNALGDTFDLAWFAMPRANGDVASTTPIQSRDIGRCEPCAVLTSTFHRSTPGNTSASLAIATTCGTRI